ncbi:MAG: TraX family protein [Oscillospiraceae bacterium]
MKNNLRACYTPTRFACLDAFWLKLIAVIAMLCDHLGYTGLASGDWLRLFGRIALPIYAFLLVEGFFNTHNVSRYALRLALFALISELPFDLMASSGSSLFCWDAQNVFFTLLLGLLTIAALDYVKRTFYDSRLDADIKSRVLGGAYGLLLAIAAVIAACALATVLYTDYSYYGVLLIVSFYLLRGHLLLIAAAQLVIFFLLMPHYTVSLTLFSTTMTVGFYGFAVFSMIPLALYNGKRGLRNPALQYAFYAFYPLHLLVLGIIVRAVR